MGRQHAVQYWDVEGGIINAAEHSHRILETTKRRTSKHIDGRQTNQLMHTPVDCIDHNLKISAFATNHVSPPLGMERGGLASELDVDEKANFTVQEELRSLEKAKAPSITGVNIVRQVAIDGNRYAEQNPSISLRKWLSNPNRVIDIVENIHIFRQIAEFVELAHSQGVVLRNIRPSSFLLSSLNRVSIIESASSGSTSSSSRSSEESTFRNLYSVFFSISTHKISKYATL